jgi:hypothetical protein
VDEEYDVTYASNAEVVQDSDPCMPTVPVRVEGPVQVRELPALSGGWGTVDCTKGTTVRLLSRDPRRKSCMIRSDTEDVYLAASQAGCGLGAFVLLKNTAMVITACDGVWVVPVTGSTRVHVYSEVWAP